MNLTVDTVKTWLESTVKMLVDHPERVEVYALEGAQAVILEVSVHAEDTRRVIGRKGRTADALRDLLTNFSKVRDAKRYQLEILEPNGAGPDRRGPQPDRYAPAAA